MHTHTYINIFDDNVELLLKYPGAFIYQYVQGNDNYWFYSYKFIYLINLVVVISYVDICLFHILFIRIISQIIFIFIIYIHYIYIYIYIYVYIYTLYIILIDTNANFQCVISKRIRNRNTYIYIYICICIWCVI